jgi:hypothetical protein
MFLSHQNPPQELGLDKDPEIAALSQKCERVKKLTELYLSKVQLTGRRRESNLICQFVCTAQ